MKMYLNAGINVLHRPGDILNNMAVIDIQSHKIINIKL